MRKTTDKFLKILDILKGEYPKWQAPVITLMAEHREDPFRILISTVLSSRTRDEVTAKASARLFEKADTPEKMLKLSTVEIERLIYPVGFFRTKALVLKKVAKRLKDCYRSLVPSTLDELLTFDGVGRKTANLVLSRAFEIPAICVDVHVMRIPNRLGVIKTTNPLETEKALQEMLPVKRWAEINTILVAFGQTICRPVRPLCPTCPINTDCRYGQNVLKKKND